MRVLLTGGSGFIALHTIDLLLRNGHDVVFTVRSEQKGQGVLEGRVKGRQGQLSYVVVPDIAREDAFKDAVVSDPPFEAVLHMASPFHFNGTDPKRDLLDPAVLGTRGILNAIHRGAPAVTRVVLTSSFVAIHEARKHNVTYSESDWNSITWEEALQSPGNAYRAGKTFAEKAAWEFMEQEKPKFDLAVLNPPLVFGPVLQRLSTGADKVNTSNERIRNLVLGKWKEHGVPPTVIFLWVDVRDVARAHVKAMEVPAAGNQRFLLAAGHYSNAALVDIVRSAFPELDDKLPTDARSDMPEDVYGFDNSKSKAILGLEYIRLEDSVIDTVRSLRDQGA